MAGKRTSKRKSPGPWRLWLRAGLVALGAGMGVLLAVLFADRPPPRQPPHATVALPLPPRAPPVAVVPPAPALPVIAAPPALPEPPAWRRYAAAPAPVEGRARIAVVIDDLGLDHLRTGRAISLSPQVTLSFMPYAGDVRQEALSARAAGHELLVHVPMEPLNRSTNMGPNGLTAGLPQDELMRRLDWDLARFDAYVGINNHMGSRFTADEDAMRLVLEAVKARGLLFLDSRTSAATVGARVAQRLGVPFAERDVFLDDEHDAGAIGARLAEVEDTARRHGTAIAIGHPHDATLAALAAWIATLPGKHLALVPLSDVVEARAGALVHAAAASAAR